MDRTRLARELVRTALAFYDRALWNRFANADAFAIRLPGVSDPLIASIMGAAGQEFGLCVYRGPRALAVFRQVLDGRNYAEVADGWDMVSVTFEPVARVPEEYTAILREAKFSGRIAPWFIAKEAGRRARATRRAENETLLFVLAGIMKADADRLLRQMPIAPRGRAAVWTLTLEGKATAPLVRAKFEQFAEESPVPAVGPVLLPDDVRRLPKSVSRWLLAAPLMPMAIDGDDRAVHAVLILDADEGDILQMTPMFGIAPDEVAAVFFDCCRGKNAPELTGVPAHVGFDQRGLYDALAPALAELSVTSDCEPSRPEVADIVASFAAAERRGTTAADAVLPAADDLEAWKRLDQRATQAIVDLATSSSRSRRLGAEYFGAKADLLDEDRDSAVACFLEWLVCHVRRNKARRTLAERALAERRLPAPLLQVLAVRAAAPISLYRIGSVTRGEGALLVDVIGGSSTFVHDRALSESAAADLLLFAKIYRVGAFVFLTAVSAPLALDHERQLAWLESQGLEVTAAGLASAPHLLGRLWGWRAVQHRTPVRLTNTDGEPVADIRVSFSAGDVAALRAALQRHADVHACGDDLAWVGPGEEPVHLARLEFVGDELVVSVNSEARLEGLRQWLRGLPDLRELGVTRRPFATPSVDDRVGADVGSEPLSDEMLAVMRKAIREHALRWLDEPIPALGGKTPRQAVRTADGQRRVARMIRSMPDPIGPSGPIADAVPRAELLRELGLEEAAG